ncbi:unnamed protein product [Brassicogethes aeneus]|nr:unnamed protein product [Brassicogethes aeneus]
MPAAFKASGLITGIFATIVVSMICTHCAYILVACAHELYKKCGVSSMGFADVAEQACLKGPKWARKFAFSARLLVLVGIFITYYATCSCYAVIVATNINFVAKEYMVEPPSLRLTISLLLVPLILLAYVPNLKYLAPISMVANAFMAVGLGITFYYLVNGLPNISDVVTEPEYMGSLHTFPVFFSITIFAIEAIGVVMPLENNMQTPNHFVGLCGVLNQGMSAVTLVYILLGFLGFLRYGKETKGSITLNLPSTEPAAQAVNILIALAVYCTFGLQFYVCLDLAWNGIKEKFEKHSLLANYILRTVLVVVCVLIAVANPTIIPFVGLIGAFCFSILGIITPILLEMLTFWDKGFGKYNWKILKNIIVVLAGVFALIFGSEQAILDIVRLYVPSANETSASNATLLVDLLNATTLSPLNITQTA